MYLDILIVLACIVGLWQGAVWLVDSAARIANRMGISELVIGLTVVAIGTSAPEFAVSVSAASIVSVARSGAIAAFLRIFHLPKLCTA